MSDREALSSDGACEAAAAYALGSLVGGEVLDFRRHLDQCVVCRDELEAFEAVVNALPMAAPQYRAPERLRRATMRAIRKEARSRTDGWWRGAGRPVLGLRRGLAAGVLAASGVVAAAIITALLLASGGSSTRVIQARVAGDQGRAEVRLSDGRSALIVRRLARPAPGHVYEIWLQRRARPPVPANVLFSVTAKGDADLGLPRSVGGATRLLVTEEPDGGSPAPTGAPLIVAQLT